MMKMKDKLFKVTYRLTPKATILRTEYIKARDTEHAQRVAERLFGIRGKVEKIEKS